MDETGIRCRTNRRRDHADHGGKNTAKMHDERDEAHMNVRA